MYELLCLLTSQPSTTASLVHSPDVSLTIYRELEANGSDSSQYSFFYGFGVTAQIVS
jgi:hypothetical protein